MLKPFKGWLIKSEQQVLPETKSGEAILYTLNQWNKLITYTDDGHLNINNNRAERCIKPFVIGRKNWFFNQTVNAAHTSAVLFSIIETTKANGLIPFDYLIHVFEHISNPDVEIDKLLPWEVILS